MADAGSSLDLSTVESHLLDLAEEMDSVFWVVTPDGELRYVSSAFETIWGRPPKSILGPYTRFLDTIHPDDRDRIEEWINEGEREQDTRTTQYRIVRPDGRTRRVRTRAFPVRNEAGQIERYVGLSDDVTQEHETRLQLEETARRFQQTFASLHDAVFIVASASRTIVECNPAAERIFGYPRDELIGARTDMLHVSKESHEAFGRQFDPVLQRDGVVSMDWTMRRKDGSAFESEHTVTRLAPSEDLEPGVVSVVRDVSHERRLELRLQQSQKLEAVGQLAAGISHDFNNVLTVIQAHAEMVRDALPEDSTLRADLDDVLEEVQRASGLTRQLLAFGRRQALQPRVLDLAKEIRSMQPTIRRLIPAHVDLKVEAADGDRNRVKVDPSQLHQVVLNLVTNAAQALDGGGTVALRIVPVELSSAQAAELPWEARPGDYVQLEVEDTGSGMPPEVLERMFEPFFTTKPAGRGTGLGLATVFGIVKQSQGHILVDSEPGHGTRVRVMLPRSDEAPAPREPEEQATVDPRAPPRAGTILMAEDDPALGRITRRVLERAGYTVMSAATFPDALELVQREGGALDLLLSDAVMPGMTGAEFVDRVRELYPDLGIVVMSGYSKDELEGGLRDKADAFLEKPFSTAGLVQVVQEALGG